MTSGPRRAAQASIWRRPAEGTGRGLDRGLAASGARAEADAGHTAPGALEVVAGEDGEAAQPLSQGAMGSEAARPLQAPHPPSTQARGAGEAQGWAGGGFLPSCRSAHRVGKGRCPPSRLPARRGGACPARGRGHPHLSPWGPGLSLGGGSIPSGDTPPRPPQLTSSVSAFRWYPPATLGATGGAWGGRCPEWEPREDPPPNFHPALSWEVDLFILAHMYQGFLKG